MPGRYEQETIENWVGDFLSGPRANRHVGGVREYASQLLVTLLAAACDHGGSALGELEEEDLRAALLGLVARLDLPGSVRDAVPALAADCLEQLQEEGRLAGGRALGSYVRALAPAFREAAGGPQKPVRRPSAKVSPNDPCPCGSGRKFKKCCAGLLG